MVAAAVFGRDDNLAAKAIDVTFEAGVPAKHEVHFSISESTASRAPTMTLSCLSAIAKRLEKEGHDAFEGHRRRQAQ
jgi:hypothetical protein